jgi:hypothetical protein
MTEKTKEQKKQRIKDIGDQMKILRLKIKGEKKQDIREALALEHEQILMEREDLMIPDGAKLWARIKEANENGDYKAIEELIQKREDMIKAEKKKDEEEEKEKPEKEPEPAPEPEEEEE